MLLPCGAAMRVAVVGHVEWIEFARVPRVPRPGEIVHASEWWEEAGGGGAVSAVQLAKLAGEADFFTALATDELGERARARLQDLGERIVPHGDDDLPWERLEGADAVYFTGGDAAALIAARRARRLVATPRAERTLRAARVPLDALVRSSGDPGERQAGDDLDPPPAFVVSTAGKQGGRWVAADRTSGSWQAAPLPGPRRDAYGAGDSFAAGLTYGLGAGMAVADALALAARCGAHKLSCRAVFDNQLTAADL